MTLVNRGSSQDASVSSCSDSNAYMRAEATGLVGKRGKSSGVPWISTQNEASGSTTFDVGMGRSIQHVVIKPDTVTPGYSQTARVAPTLHA